jgi:hypothetical protein
MTTATATASARGRANRRKGHDTERQLARWFRTQGWPGAERAVRTGFTAADRAVADPGDITGMPGLVVQAKYVAREQIDSWMAETEQQRAAAGADYGLLVVRRTGRADPGQWWVWLPLRGLTRIATGLGVPAPHGDTPVRLELGHLVPLLRDAGYGTTPAEVA